jgi:hypothetical protein
MDENPLTPVREADSSPNIGRRPAPREGWKWYLGLIFVLIAGVPALVLLVFYYRTVAATYYLTRNPLQPSSRMMAQTMEGVLIGNMRDLSATAESLIWSGSAPSPDTLRETIGKSIQSGELRGFSGMAVIDRNDQVLATQDKRDIDPYLDSARSLARDLLATGGFARIKTVSVPGRTPMTLLLVAVRTGKNDSGHGGVLVGLQNLSALMNRYILVPKIPSSPGYSYLLSSSGEVLAASDRAMVGKNISDLGRKQVLERFLSGKSGPFVKTVDGKSVLFGSSLLVDLTGLSQENWFAVLEAPKNVVDAQADRIRLNLDLIVFLLLPAFMGIVIFLLYRSLRG